MKKVLFFIMLLNIGISFAQDGPKIKFKSETIDYGIVTKGEDDGLRIFEFTNEGNAPLVITNVSSSCGCTIPSKPKDPILPGKTGEIQVKYNMATGPIRKTISVESNAVNVEGGRVGLKITGEVKDKQNAEVSPKKSAEGLLEKPTKSSKL